MPIGAKGGAFFGVPEYLGGGGRVSAGAENERRGRMPAFAAQLTDAQIAAVVDHERISWGKPRASGNPESSEARPLRTQGPNAEVRIYLRRFRILYGS